MLNTNILSNTCSVAALHWDTVYFGKKLPKLSFVLGFFFLVVGDKDEMEVIPTS